MKTLTLKIICGLAVLFGVGICTGFVLARPRGPFAQTASSGYASCAQRWLDARIAEYTRRLNLTPAQVAAMRPHCNAALTEVEEVHNDVRTRVNGIIKDMNAHISEVMTPEQRQEFRRLLKEKAQRRQAANGTD
jgi:hypothetical protein